MADTITDEQKASLARQYISDYWSDHVLAIGLREALVTPPASYDQDVALEKELSGYEPIMGTPLRESLGGISDKMLDAMEVAYKNIQRKIFGPFDEEPDSDEDTDDGNFHVEDDEVAPSEDPYDEQWAAAVRRSDIAWRGIFDRLASCQGGDEVDLIYGHPIHGEAHTEDGPTRMDEDEYRRRSSPYVALFGVELYPGDAEAGLVLDSVKHRLEPAE
ncbi:hypothetical protein Bequi_09895 [Brachybacterium sp. JHP9]|uniref:Uncharacterized protein n=1 Tax=Brachybacterium equifaecis TaxID=2910770 RepID=A0ABT0R1P5_9MICO|nr:hypothetical protein [Brachybacterium equifaecis]MCL6423695.1 hypothetical protein [Brachybacterium equifaecis]